MKKLISKLLFLTFIALLSGCAAYYKPINPPGLEYTAHDLQDEVTLSYKYDVLREKGNRKYANKEKMSDIRLIAVRITNNTDTALTIGRDITLYAEGSPIYLMEPYEIKEIIKQYPAGYLAYSSIAVADLLMTEGQLLDHFAISIALGPLLGIANTALAGSSNKQLLTELKKYSIINRKILPGETVYGLIGVYDIFYSPISVKKNSNNTFIR